MSSDSPASQPDPANALRQAWKLMRSALKILGAVDAPKEIGAHLDLAIVRLEESSSLGMNPKSPDDLGQ